MKERRGRIGSVAAAAEEVAAAVRERQRRLEPRVLLYGRDGVGIVLAPGEPAHAELVTLAEELLELGAEPG